MGGSTLTPDTLFTICTNGVVPAWLLLGLAPGWIWTQRIVHSLYIPVLLALVYGSALLTVPGVPEGANISSLRG